MKLSLLRLLIEINKFPSQYLFNDIFVWSYYIGKKESEAGRGLSTYPTQIGLYTYLKQTWEQHICECVRCSVWLPGDAASVWLIASCFLLTGWRGELLSCYASLSQSVSQMGNHKCVLIYTYVCAEWWLSKHSCIVLISSSLMWHITQLGSCHYPMFKLLIFDLVVKSDKLLYHALHSLFHVCWISLHIITYNYYSCICSLDSQII